jgi:hypothetical protein
MNGHSIHPEVTVPPTTDEKHVTKENTETITPLSALDADAEIAEKNDIQSDRTYGIDEAYVQKSQLIAGAMQSIGMTSWQYQVWILCGFGWIVDNVSSSPYNIPCLNDS